MNNPDSQTARQPRLSLEPQYHLPTYSSTLTDCTDGDVQRISIPAQHSIYTAQPTWCSDSHPCAAPWPPKIGPTALVRQRLVFLFGHDDVYLMFLVFTRGFSRPINGLDMPCKDAATTCTHP